MKGLTRTKLVFAFAVVFLLGGASQVLAQVYSDGQIASESGNVIGFNVSAEMQTSAFGGFAGQSSGALKLDDDSQQRFVTLGDDSPTVVLATTYAGELIEGDLMPLNSTDLQILDSILGLSGTESFEQVYTESKELIFGEYNSITYFKTLGGNFESYILKRNSEGISDLHDIVFVGKVQMDGTLYNGYPGDYSILQYAGTDAIYNFATI